MHKIVITYNDRKKLLDMLEHKHRLSSYEEALLDELQRAELALSEEIPDDVITMNSQIRFTDVDTGEKMTYWLSFPDEADLSSDRISVLSPVGCELLGYRKGDEIEVGAPSGLKILRIEEILHQPEAAGNFA